MLGGFRIGFFQSVWSKTRRIAAAQNARRLAGRAAAVMAADPGTVKKPGQNGALCLARWVKPAI
jgi:hypothetical protein